jgi:ribosome-associated protein
LKSIARIFEGCQRELALDFVRASGPGGQNVNKVATAVQLRFDIAGSAWLDADSKQRMVRLGGKRITPRGTLVIEAGRYRTQARNRADAVARFFALLEKCLRVPKSRRKTSASAASKERRLRAKKIRGQIKRVRRSPGYD